MIIGGRTVLQFGLHEDTNETEGVKELVGVMTSKKKQATTGHAKRSNGKHGNAVRRPTFNKGRSIDDEA